MKKTLIPILALVALIMLTGGGGGGEPKKGQNIDCNDKRWTRVYVKFHSSALNHSTCNPAYFPYCPPLSTDPWNNNGGILYPESLTGQVNTVFEGCGSHLGTYKHWYNQTAFYEPALSQCYINVSTHKTVNTKLEFYFTTNCGYCVPNKRVVYYTKSVIIPPNTPTQTIYLEIEPLSINPANTNVGQC